LSETLHEEGVMEKYRILIADDHALVRAGMRKALEKSPDLNVVTEVGDGPTLFRALDKHEIDLLLIDLTMPDFEPVPAIKTIRTKFPSVKILVVSAHDDREYVQELLKAGIEGYHLKDQPLSDLQLAVERLRAGKRWFSSSLVDKLIQYSEENPILLPSLTRRQREVLRLLQQGLDNQSIAMKMGLSVKTVENHFSRLYRELKVQSRLEAVMYAMEHPEVLGNQRKETNQYKHVSEIPANTFSILIVDDNERFRYNLQRMIKKAYLQVVTFEAESIEEAVQLVKSINPPLIMVDVVLGDEDGIQCTRRIKAIKPSSQVILMSAYPDREFHRLGLEAGAVAFLDKKDIDQATIRQMIENSIDQV